MTTIKSIEEKAKRYDEAIKRVEDIVGGKCPKPFMFTEGLFDYIFPELKESEDEKIRACIEMCLTDIDEQRFADFNTNLKECLAWLEKKGEQKSQCKLEDDVRRRSTIQVLEYARSLDTYNQYGKADIDKNIAWLEKQGEQKPQGKSALEAIKEEKVDNANKVEPQDEFTKFEKAVKQVLEEAIECGDTHNLKADADMLLNLARKSAWSEEDEAHIMAIDLAVNRCLGKWHCCGEKCPISEHNPWLKCLKERVLPQNTWKPSDEQINVLAELLIFAASHESPHWNDYVFGILKNLTRQLKKLRGE